MAPRDAVEPPAPQPRPGSTEPIRASPAGVFRRVGAWIVDAAIVALFVAAYLRIAQALMAHPPPPTDTTGLDWLVNRVDAYHGILKYGLALGAAVGVVYSSLFHALGGRTPGKLLTGIRLVDGSGRAPSLPRCLIRAVLSVFSVGVLALGYLGALFVRRRRALHDALTGTFVERLRPR